MKRILSLLIITILALSCQARQLWRGYRGFVDWSNSLGSVDYWGTASSTSVLYTGISTAHGYQFNPMFFVGGGLDIEHCRKIDSTILALYAVGRADFKFDRFTPFGDVRLGYNFSEGAGVYFSPSVGYRFNWGRKVGVNVGLGLTLQGYSTDIYDVTADANGYISYYKIDTRHSCKALFSFRLGFDF